MDKIARYLLIIISLFGTYAGTKLSVSHLHTGETCPMIGPVPACFVVLAGYAIIFLSTVFRGKLKSGHVFYLGWVPVFGLAALGATSELMGKHICPISAGGIPQCFYSLAMITVCLVLFLIYNRRFAK